MDKADAEGNNEEIRRLNKEFFLKVIKPCQAIKLYSYASEEEKPNELALTYKNYQLFITEVTRYLLAQKVPYSISK